MVRIALHINGEKRETEIDPATPLLFVLRNEFGLTGAKLGCGQEQCGACAVLVNGQKRLSCVAPAAEFADAEITTVEGLTEDGRPGPVQQAMIDEAAAQCGYCTPGLVVAIEALRRADKHPGTDAITEALADHLCRCGTHAAVLRVIGRLIADRDAP